MRQIFKNKYCTCKESNNLFLLSFKRIHDVWAKRAAAGILTVCTIEGSLIQETDQLLLTASDNNGISWSHAWPRSHLDTIYYAQPLNIQQISLPSRALCYRPVDYNSDFTPPAGSCIVTQSARVPTRYTRLC